LDVGRVGDVGEDDGGLLLRHVGGRVAGDGALLDERRGLGGGAVPDEHAVAVLEEVGRHRGAHDAQADVADGGSAHAGVIAREARRELKRRCHSLAGTRNLRPRMPAMMRARQARRSGWADSPKTAMPRITLPTAPMPVHTAYAVPSGSERMAQASRIML